MRACPNVSDACLVLLRCKQRKKQEVNDFGESTSGESSAFGYGPWRWYRGVGDIHMNRGD
jgi:hypothetical protein